jgi:hypothetical protein
MRAKKVLVERTTEGLLSRLALDLCFAIVCLLEARKEPPMLCAMQVKRALQRGDQVLMVQLSELKLDSQILADKKLADVLKEYEDVFKLELFHGLPPVRIR